MLLYHIPTHHQTACPPELLTEHYLDAVIDTPIICPVTVGPSGKPGLIIVDAELSKTPVKYDQSGQTWVQSLDTDAWIGYVGKTPPRVHALARRQRLPGKPLKLASGETLQIPIAQRYVESNDQLYTSVALPQSLGRDPETKQWVPKTIVGTYRALWDHLTAYIEAQEAALRTADVEDGESVWFHYEGLHQLIIAAINANYRIAADEIELLGIYDQSLQTRIIDILTDRETRDAWVKKKLAALLPSGSTSAAGPTPSTTESTPDTTQP